VDIWGGEQGLKEIQERDKRKKKLCENNQVRILEWSYKTPVNEENVVKFMKDNSIPFSENIENYSSDTEMAPIIVSEPKISIKKLNKKPKEKVIKDYIVKYDLSGNYVEQYSNIGSAAENAGVSVTSIYKVIRGQRNSSAGYIWRKIGVEEMIPQSIEVNFNMKSSCVEKFEKI
jgi:hypothetical protein